jgi:uncharacterized protein YndB with AHSA1/START domain
MTASITHGWQLGPGAPGPPMCPSASCSSSSAAPSPPTTDSGRRGAVIASTLGAACIWVPSATASHLDCTDNRNSIIMALLFGCATGSYVVVLSRSPAAVATCRPATRPRRGRSPARRRRSTRPSRPTPATVTTDTHTTTSERNITKMTAKLLAPLRVSIEIAAPPAEVWRVVSDVRRTPEWSPECTRVVPIGVVGEGSWMFGFNRRKAVRWPTLSRFVQYKPDREIAWVVRTNGAIWKYKIEATEAGSRLIETRETPNGIGRFARLFTRVLLGGQGTHDHELESGMASGLERIKAAIEG